MTSDIINGRIFRGDIHVAQTRFNHVGEVEQAIFPLVLRPPFLEIDESRWPRFTAQHQTTEAIQLLKGPVAVFLQL